MRYYMKRPAEPGAMPREGLVEILPGEQPEWLQRQVWNVLVYDRELSRREVMDYELIPDLPPIQYKGYEIRFMPYTWEWAIIDYESEYDAMAYCQSLDEAKRLINKHEKR